MTETRRFYRVGLTGGMGSGKTEVRKMLEQRGLPAIDADALAKTIAAEDAEARAEICAAFGAEMYDDRGRLQRQLLATKVFGHPRRLQRLNSILHPRVFAATESRLRRLAGAGHRLAIIEAALIYESGWDRQMDAVVVVSAPESRRLQWLQERDHVGVARIRVRLQHQLDEAEKIKRADFIIQNDKSLQDLSGKVDALVAWLEEKFALKLTPSS